jgi:peroxiredoxin
MLALAVVLALAASVARAAGPGDAAIGFSLPEYHSGEIISLDDYAGQVVYLDFWASWCAPCLKSFPYYDDLYRQIGRERFTIIAVNLDEDTEDARRFLERHPVGFPVAFDPSGKSAAGWRIAGMPSSFLIGTDQQVKRAWVGFRMSHTQEIEDEIRALLAH